MKKIFVFIFLIVALNSNAQVTFQKVYRTLSVGEQINSFSMQQTSDGGFVAGCWSYATGSLLDIWIIKTDGNGDTLWTRSFDFGGEDMCRSIHQTTDGGYILTGSGVGLGGSYLLRTDSNGNFLWAKSYAGSIPEGEFVRQTNDGGYIFTGSTAGVTISSNVFVIKTDASGNIQWAKTYGGADYDAARCIRQTLDGGYIISGTSASFGTGEWDILVIKTDANGAVLWSKTYGTGDISSQYIQQTADSGYVIAGNSEDSPYPSCLVKTDVNGNLMWSKMYQNGFGYFVQQTLDGGYVTLGNYRTGLIKTDASGTPAWAKYYLGLAYSGQVLSDHGYLFGGYLKDSTTFLSLFIARTDPYGNAGCTNDFSVTVTTPSLQITSPSISAVNINPVVTPRTVTVNSRVIPAVLCPVGVNELSNNDNSISLFPNPATDGFTIYPEYSGRFTIENVEIYSALGEKVFSQKLAANSQQQVINIDAAEWNNGIYFVKVKTSDGEKTQKLVVQH